MRTLLIKIGTAFRLGPSSLARVAFYKVGIKTGINPVRRLEAGSPLGPFFSHPTQPADQRAVPRVGWYKKSEGFGQSLNTLDQTPPQWLSGCFSNERVEGSERNWWQVPDFDPAVGDIKTVWEFSRFDWVLSCAQNAAKGDEAALLRLNHWISDWLKVNPPYRGPNWKCGQEASIRVMHLAIAAHLLGQIAESTASLLDLIELHLDRISPTVMYAMAQNNNHGTSEAAALFIGGSFLEANGRLVGNKLMHSGRKWLENRVRRLIEKDGSFSQHSLNYHRVMLDSISMAELWRRQLGLVPFSRAFYLRAASASEWLRYMTQPFNGDGPNFGANDGARLLQLTDTDYRDYRPSIQLSSVLFHSALAFSKDGDWNQPLYWLRLPLPEIQLPAPSSVQFDGGGYFICRKGSAMALIGYPRYRYRPGQADALHLDFWLDGENWLRDAGSFSYNTDQRWLDYFRGTAAHNTVQFDDRDQMPRLSRFLLGAWLKARKVEPLVVSDGVQSCSAGYRDWKGSEHHRSIVMTKGDIRVTDKIAHFESRAVLRWRLKPGDWSIEVDTNRIQTAGFSLAVASNVPIKRFEIVEGWESRYYLRKTPIPVLEVEVALPGELTTIIKWEKS
ncbi:heparinase II/III family protein [Halopseudomonas bauzanensis]|uniref:Heparinase n=1 Tax=Halopseudomonas bauzanensis TaxID=653930 RepID=A0A4U0YN71_9GAMM|nr:heparinase II/III-family protein [Halopseudomonas bauzanensis]TKA90991.1 heparinase [Halopseudomonas bauzanensis]